MTAPRPLAGLRVIEAGTGLSTAFAGRLLCDLGAEVVIVEPMGGIPLRHRPPFVGDVGSSNSAAAAYFAAGKRSITIADEPPSRWTANADLILTDGTLPDFGVADAEALQHQRPELVVVDISAWGRSGPFQAEPGHDLLVLAASGFLSIASTLSSEPGDPMPIRPPGELSSILGACAAALAGVAALWDGHGAAIEVSTFEAVTSSMATAWTAVSYADNEPTHDGTRGVVPWAIYQCIGGDVLVQITEDSQWRTLIRLLGDPEWGHLEMFETNAGRVEHAESVEALVAAAMSEVDAEEFLTAARREGVAASSINGAAEVLSSEHLAVREFFAPIELPNGDLIDAPTSPYLFDGLRPVGDRALRSVGVDNGGIWTDQKPSGMAGRRRPTEAKRPLAGVRVLDLTWVWAGPYAAMQLAHLGADVVKVESSTRPDITRLIGPFADEMPGLDRSGYFNQYNQGKSSIRLDLSSPEGRETLGQLIADSDVLIENMRAGALERMGFSDDRLMALNSNLVTVSLSGFGATGPERDRQAYGSIIDAVSGVNALIGPPGGGPTEMPMSLPDPGSGLPCAFATICGLLSTRRSGRGVRVDVSMVESWIAAIPWGVLHLAATGAELMPDGSRDPMMSPHGIYRCQGSYDWIAVVVPDDAAFESLAGLLAAPELARELPTVEARRAAGDRLDELLTAWTLGRGSIDAAASLVAAGVPARPVRRVREVVACPHLSAREFIVSLPHADVGERSMPGVPWRSESWPPGPLSSAPLFGADSVEVLGARLGKKRLAELEEAGVIS